MKAVRRIGLVVHPDRQEAVDHVQDQTFLFGIGAVLYCSVHVHAFGVRAATPSIPFGVSDGVSQLPVSERPEGDEVAGLVGAISEKGLLDRAFRDPSVVDRTVGERARHRGDVVTPISTSYRGLDVVELPPNGQGIGALETLNILSQFPLGSYPPRGAQELHAQIEAVQLALADLHQYIADPRFRFLSRSLR